MFMRWALAAAMLTIGPATLAKADVAGIVIDQNNHPVRGARVYGSKTTCCPVRADETRTDADGGFRLSDPGKVVYIRADGFRPTSRVLTSSTSRLSIVLEPADNSAWKIRDCRTSQAAPSAKFLPEIGKQFGYVIRFSLPRRNRVRKDSDVDYVLYWARFGKTDQWLQVWSGVNVGSSGDAHEDWLVDSSNYSERRISGSSWGIDSRGVFKDGTRWRSANFAIGQEYVRYKGATAEAAAYFDDIIDSACLLPAPATR